jgi:hypothetical protein
MLVPVTLVLDDSEAAEFTAPMVQAKDAAAAQQAMLRIPDEAGKPPEGTVPNMQYGGARFVVNMPRAVTCRIWLRVWWEGACGNTVAVRVNDGEPVTAGNDGTYNAWHWVLVPGEFALAAGAQQVYVLNREDGIRLDQVMITSDMDYTPQGIE